MGEEWLTADSALAHLMESSWRTLQPFVVVGRSTHHKTVELGLNKHLYHTIYQLFIPIGRHLHKYRAIVGLSASEIDQCLHNRQQHLLLIRPLHSELVDKRLDVKGEVVDILVEVAEHFQVVAHRTIEVGQGVLGDVGTHTLRRLLTAATQVVECIVQTTVLKSDTVEQRTVGLQSEESGTGIACLRFGGESTNLHKSPAECPQLAIVATIDIESCRDADGIGEADSKNLALQETIFVGVTLGEQPTPESGAAYTTKHPQAEAVLTLHRED